MKGPVQRLARCLVLLGLGLGLAGTSAGSDYQAEREPRRLALVIGNADYDHLEALPSARADALAMEVRLHELGFEVSRELDVLTLADLEDRVLPAFRSKIQPGDLVLVYFSGHGFAYGPDTWLAPTQLPRRLREADVADSAPSVEGLQAYLGKRAPGLLLLLVDACRTVGGPVIADAYSESLPAKGPAPPQRPAGLQVNMITGFASEPGTASYASRQGTTSLFTGYLLRHLGRDGREFSTLFNDLGAEMRADTQGLQHPGYYDWSDSDLFLPPGPGLRLQEREAWQVALASGSPKQVQRFAWRFALSRHAQAARLWLAEHQGMGEPAAYSALSPLAVERAWSASGPTQISRVDTGLAFSRHLSLDAMKALPGSRVLGLYSGAEGNGSSSERSRFARERLLAHGEVVTTQSFPLYPTPGDHGGEGRALRSGSSLQLTGFVTAGGGELWAAARAHGDEAPVYFPLPRAETAAPVSLGRPLREVSLAPLAQGLPELLDVRELEVQLAQVKAQGLRVSWISLATQSGDSPEEELARAARLQHALYTLKRLGVDGRRITTVSGSAEAIGPGVRLRIFGYPE